VAILDNRTQKAVNTDVGFKISKPGYDAKRTVGQNLVYSSSWPSLAVAFETTITNPLTGGGATGTVNHKLNFPPFTFVWAIGPDPSGLTGTVSERRIPGAADVDKDNVYLKVSGLSGIETDFLYTATKLHIKCFQLDLSKDIDYILAAGETFKTPYDNNFGIKFAKPNKLATSTDLRDFAVHSRCQSALVLAVKTIATSDPANPTTVQYTNKFATPVWVYGFVRSTALKYKWAALGGQAYPITKTDGFVTNLAYVGAAGDDNVTIVVLRDPMFAPNAVLATY
jgi:hypothetical protein